MDKMMKSAMVELELTDGKEVKLTLNFRRLLDVRNKRKDIYTKYNKIMMNGPDDVFDNLTVLYTAYLCGAEDMDSCMSYDEFVDVIPPYMSLINEKVMELTRPKKQQASEKHSEADENEDHQE